MKISEFPDFDSALRKYKQHWITKGSLRRPHEIEPGKWINEADIGASGSWIEKVAAHRLPAPFGGKHLKPQSRNHLFILMANPGHSEKSPPALESPDGLKALLLPKLLLPNGKTPLERLYWGPKLRKVLELNGLFGVNRGPIERAMYNITVIQLFPYATESFPTLRGSNAEGISSVEVARCFGQALIGAALQGKCRVLIARRFNDWTKNLPHLEKAKKFIAVASPNEYGNFRPLQHRVVAYRGNLPRSVPMGLKTPGGRLANFAIQG